MSAPAQIQPPFNDATRFESATIVNYMAEGKGDLSPAEALQGDIDEIRSSDFRVAVNGRQESLHPSIKVMMQNQAGRFVSLKIFIPAQDVQTQPHLTRHIEALMSELISRDRTVEWAGCRNSDRSTSVIYSITCDGKFTGDINAPTTIKKYINVVAKRCGHDETNNVWNPGKKARADNSLVQFAAPEVGMDLIVRSPHTISLKDGDDDCMLTIVFKPLANRILPTSAATVAVRTPFVAQDADIDSFKAHERNALNHCATEAHSNWEKCQLLCEIYCSLGVARGNPSLTVACTTLYQSHPPL